VSPKCVCEVSAQNTPQIMYYNNVGKVSVHVSLNANELPTFQKRAEPLQLVPRILCQKLTTLLLIWINQQQKNRKSLTTL